MSLQSDHDLQSEISYLDVLLSEVETTWHLPMVWIEQDKMDRD